MFLELQTSIQDTVGYEVSAANFVTDARNNLWVPVNKTDDAGVVVQSLPWLNVFFLRTWIVRGADRNALRARLETNDPCTAAGCLATVGDTGCSSL